MGITNLILTLHLAPLSKFSSLNQFCVRSLSLRYQVNAVDTLGQTSLHRAALAGHIQTCRLLLSYGADPSIVSLQGFTAAQMGNEAVQQILNGKPLPGCVPL